MPKHQNQELKGVGFTEKDSIQYSITEHIGTICTFKSGWTMELNLVSWNGNRAKFDIRSWSPDHKTFGKGITLHYNDFISLAGLINEKVFSEEKQASYKEIS